MTNAARGRRRRIGLAALAAAAALVGPLTAGAETGPRSVAGTPIQLAQATTPAPESKAGQVFSPDQKKAIESIIKDYLLANPEVMLEIQTALESRMEELQAKKLQVAITSNAAEIYRSPDAPVAGNPNGDVTVVEFFDYNCGYCKRAFSDIAKLIEKDKGVKLVLKELPILSKGSEEGTRVALAAKIQGKYWEVHRALLSMRGQISEQTALAAAEKLGLDMTKLKTDMKSDAVTKEISRVRDLAQSMGIQGTPHFLIGDRAIAGAPQELLSMASQHITDIRNSGGCKVC